MILFNCWSVNNMTVGRSLQTTSRIKPGKVVFCSSTTDASGSFFTLSDGFWVRYSICFVYRGSELMAWVSITPPASFLAKNKTKFLSFLYNFQLGTLFRPDMWLIGWGTIAMLFDLKSRGRTIKIIVKKHKWEPFFNIFGELNRQLSCDMNTAAKRTAHEHKI